MCALGARLTGRLFLFRFFCCVLDSGTSFYIIFIHLFVCAASRRENRFKSTRKNRETLPYSSMGRDYELFESILFILYIFFGTSRSPSRWKSKRAKYTISFVVVVVDDTGFEFNPLSVLKYVFDGNFFFLRLFLVDWCMCASSTHSVYSYVYYGNDQRRFARMCLFFKSCFFPTAPSSLVRHNQAVVMCFPPHMNCTQNRFSFFSVFISHTKRGARQSRIGWVCTRRLMETAATTMTI